MTATLESLMNLCERIAPSDQSALTPFWVEQSRRLYEGAADVFVGECGRGSIKSGWGSRIAFNEVVCGDFVVPPGECHFWIDVSENMLEARQRLTQYEEWCLMCGIPFEKRGDAIVLPELRRGFLVRAAEVGRLSGFRAVGFRVDEGAKLSSDGTDPLPELWASGTAMLVSHLKRRPKRLLLSSPLALVGFFNEMVRRGNTDDQIVAEQVPTWVANPSISEEQTHRLEPNERVWRREYAALAQSAVSAAFDGDDAMACFGKFPEGYAPARWTLLLDPSGGGDDPFAWALVGWVHGPRVPEFVLREKYLGWGMTIQEHVLGEDGQPIRNPRFEKDSKPPILRVGCYGQIEKARSRNLSLEAIVRGLVTQYCRPNDVRLAIGDQFQSFALESLFPSLGVRFIALPWTNTTKIDSVARLGTLFRERGISIADDCIHTKEMQRQTLSYDERISKSGAIKYAGRGSVHDDLTTLLMLACRADAESLLPLSPYSPQRRGPSHAEVLNQLFGADEPPAYTVDQFGRHYSRR